MTATKKKPTIEAVPEVQAPPPSLNLKLVEVMSEVGHMVKRGHNNHHNYAFATANDVYDAIRSALVSRAISFLPSMQKVEQDGPKTRIEFLMSFTDCETGETLEARWWGEANDKQDKGINKAATAAVKYFFLRMFLVSARDEQDPDDTPTLKYSPGRVEEIKGQIQSCGSKGELKAFWGRIASEAKRLGAYEELKEYATQAGGVLEE